MKNTSKHVIFFILAVLLSVGGLLFTFQSTNHLSVPHTNVTPTPKPFSVSQNTRCIGTPLPTQIEGPYYKQDSPERTDITDNQEGVRVHLTGVVYNTHCTILPHAWLDFWQANSKGIYDNAGYTLRGHQLTDAQGRFVLDTIVPGQYENRPPHIHVKVRATDTSPIYTYQLYFPNEQRNTTDKYFKSPLLMNVTNTPEGKTATFSFVIPSD